MSTYCATWFDVQTFIHHYVDSKYAPRLDDQFRNYDKERDELTKKLNALIPLLIRIDVRNYICEFSGHPVYRGDIQQAIQLMLFSAIPAYLKYGSLPEPDMPEEPSDPNDIAHRLVDDESEAEAEPELSEYVPELFIAPLSE